MPSVPAKPNPAPPEKTRPMYWNKIPDVAADKTLWKNIDDSKCNVQPESILAFFKAGVATPAKSTVEEVGAPVNVPKAAKISFLTSDRDKALSIMLSRMRLPPKDIVDIVTCVDQTLNPEQVSTILKVMPTEEEIAALKAYDDDMSKLASSDLFVLEVSQAPFFAHSCELIMMRSTAVNQVAKVRDSLRVECQAVKQVSESQSLKLIMATVLKMGNILNGGGNRGGAYGFRVAALAKLGDARAAIPGKTLLTFLVQTLEKNCPSALGLEYELSKVYLAAEIELDSVKSQIGPLKGKCTAIKAAASNPSAPSGFVSAALDVCEQIEPILAEVDSLFEEASTKSRKLLTDFFEDPAKTKPAEFFTTLKQFMTGLRDEKARIDAERAEQARRSRAPGAGGHAAGAMQRGVMDELLNKIKNGQLKRNG